MDAVSVGFHAERRERFHDFGERRDLFLQNRLGFILVEYPRAVGVQKSHELVQVRPLLREFVRRHSQRLRVYDPDCLIVGIGEKLSGVLGNRHAVLAAFRLRISFSRSVMRTSTRASFLRMPTSTPLVFQNKLPANSAAAFAGSVKSDGGHAGCRKQAIPKCQFFKARAPSRQGH